MNPIQTLVERFVADLEAAIRASVIAAIQASIQGATVKPVTKAGPAMSSRAT